MSWRSLRLPKQERQPDRRQSERSTGRHGARAHDPKWMCLLMEMPFVGVAIMNARSREWIRVNDRFCSLLGYTRDELAHLNWSQICHPVDRGECGRMLRRIETLPEGRDRMWHRLVRKDGSIVTVEVALSKGDPRSRAGDFIIALVHEQPAATGTDRTREHRLFAEEEVALALIEQSIFGIYVVDQGEFTFVNARMGQIFGYTPEEIRGMAVADLVTEDDRAKVLENIRRRIEHEVASVKYEFRGRRKDGSIVDVGVHGTTARVGNKSVIVGVIQDITEKIHAEISIHRYVQALERAMQSTIEVVSLIGEMRDPYTQGHERRVGELGAAIGAELGLDANRIEGIRIAGYLHDVGKMGIPAELLAKPTRLSRPEFELVKGHAHQSFEILKGVDFPWPVALTAQQHHERLDGSGYPQGLKGDAILQEARILAVADVMEAMSSHRPYRPALGMDRALEEIRRGRGTAYDPDATDACESVFSRGYVLSS